MRSDGTRQTNVKSNQRKRASKHLAKLNVSFIFLDIERAGGASDCEIISLAARTGWDDEIPGGPGSFEVFILPVGNIDPVASSMSHKMSKSGGVLLNGRREELVTTDLKSALSEFVTYVKKVEEMSIKPVHLITHGTIDIPNLLIALDSCQLTDSVLPMKFIDFELVVSKSDIYKEFFIKLILCFKELTQT